jgi:hypothetical protein
LRQNYRYQLLKLLYLYFQNSLINWVVLTGNGNKANIRCQQIKKKQNNAQRHSPRPIPNDLHYIWPPVAFAGHYL